MKYNLLQEMDGTEFGGIGLQGTFKAPISQIMQAIGSVPMLVDSKRIQYRWLIRFEDGTVATVYNEKGDTENNWCIGGFGKSDKQKNNIAVKYVKELLNVA